MSDQFIGSGWGFPLRTSSNGSIALVSREKEIEEAVSIILRTAPGERPMRPEFGCGIHNYVFAPTNPTTMGLIAYEVERALEQWEPRIDVDGVDIVPDPEDSAILYIDVQYTIRGTNDPRNLVYPFYTIPPEE